MENTITLDSLIKLYTDQNWEYLLFDDISSLKEKIKPNLSDSFGTKLPILSPGVLIHFPIKDVDGSHLLYTFSSVPVADVLNTKKEDIYNTLNSININTDVDFNFDNMEQVSKLIDDAKQSHSESLQVIGRVLIVEDNVVKCSVKFLFILDNNANVPFESIIVFDDADTIVLLLSPQFKEQFENESQSIYLTNVILSSISFILEYYK